MFSAYGNFFQNSYSGIGFKRSQDAGIGIAVILINQNPSLLTLYPTSLVSFYAETNREPLRFGSIVRYWQGKVS